MDAIAARARHRSGRGAPPQPHRTSRNALSAAVSTLGDDIVIDSGDYAGCSTRRWPRSTGRRCRPTSRARRAAGEAVGAGLAHVRGEERPRPFRRRARHGRSPPARSRSSPAPPRSARASRRWWRRSAPTRSASTTGACASSTARPTASRSASARFASRVTVMTGEATRIAALQAARQGARRCGASCCSGARRSRHRRRRVVTRDGAGPSIASPRSPARSRRLAAARRSRRRASPPKAGSIPTTWSIPMACHIAVVRVDRDTGGVTVERYLVAYDIGRAVNPLLVEGQIAGGFAQGIGGALLEEFRYDERGEPLSVTFADYLMPTAREMPRARGHHHRGCAEPAQSARPQGRRRSRHQRRRRRDRHRHRRRHRHARRDHRSCRSRRSGCARS